MQQGQPAISFQGVQNAAVELAPFGVASVDLDMLPLRAGIHTISNISLQEDAEQRPLGTLVPTQVFVTTC